MKRLAVLVGLLSALVSPVLAAEQRVYASSQTSTADTSQTIASGRAQLYKIVVSSAGITNAAVTILDANGTKLAELDASAVRDVEYNVPLSTGLVYTTAGTTAPKVAILWSKSLDLDNNWSIKHSTGVYTTRAIFSGRGLLKAVIVGKAGTAPSAVTIYDSNATSTGRIIDILGTESVRSRVDYNVAISSGLTYTSTGNPAVTFIYQKQR